MLTETEAKTRWCPMGAGRPMRMSMAAGSFGSQQIVAVEAPMSEARCIGSACMMWETTVVANERWLVELDGKPAEVWHWNPEGRAYYAGRVKVSRAPAPDLPGYCGLSKRRESR